MSPAVTPPAVTPRLRRMLLWTFDEFFALDPEMFLAVLAHEHVILSPPEINQLVCELSDELVRKDRARMALDLWCKQVALISDDEPDAPHEPAAADRFPREFRDN